MPFIRFMGFSVVRAWQGFWRNAMMSIAATATVVLMLVLLAALFIVISCLNAGLEFIESKVAVTVRLVDDLQLGFALNQPLSTFALGVFDVLDPEEATYALDVVSVIEATLDDPRTVLGAQEHKARGEAIRSPPSSVWWTRSSASCTTSSASETLPSIR